jgi:tRNA pseudouridine13 synthase
MKQERRSLRIALPGLEWQWPGADRLRLGFALPAGSYATAMLHELGGIRDA